MKPETLAYYRRLSETYDETIRQLVPAYDEMTALVVERITRRSPHTVLDVGCGTGTLSEQVLDRLPEVAVTALDASPEMIGHAQARLGRFGRRARLVEGDVATCRLEPGFDVVFSSLVLHNIPFGSKTAVLRSVVRLLAPSGTFVWADLIRHASPARQAEAVAFRREFALRAGCDPGFVELNFHKEANADSPLTVEQMANAVAGTGSMTSGVVWAHDTFAVLEFERGAA
ncbi:MAG: class I SAM-dependent methyltransferase [Gemmatimonadota bacterium]|nr:class I SAM-dependent methyltransferase [Gemmatimonadota bacterium]